MKDRIIEIGKDSAWYLSSNIAVSIIGFIALPILTRVFDPREYGFFSLVNTTIALASPIFWSWIANAVIRFYPELKDRGELDVYYSTSMRLGIYILALFLLLALPIAGFALPLGEYRLLVCLGVLIFAFHCQYSILQALMRARRMAWQYGVFAVFIQFSRYIAGAAVAVWLGAGVTGPFWSWLAGLLIVLPLEYLVLGMNRYVRWSKHSKALEKQFFRYGFPLIVATFLAEVLSAADRYMLQAMKGATQVGLYSMAYTLVTNLEGVIATFLVMGSAPVIVRVFEREGEQRAEVLIGKLTRYFLMLLLPVLIGVWLLRVPVIRVLTSVKYLGAEGVFLPVAMGIFLFYIAWLPVQAFTLHKNTRKLIVPMGVATCLNIGLNLVLIPAFGLDGAAWATAIAYGVYFVIVTVIGVREMRWRFPWAAAARIAAACAVMSGTLLLLLRLDWRGIGGLLAYVLAGTAAYLLVLLILRTFTRTELETVSKVMGRIPLVGRLFQRSKSKTEEECR